MNTEIEVVKGLKLSDPFMIASSHWTSNETYFRQLAKVEPSAVTLKTTSERIGGDGLERSGKKRNKQRIYDSFNNAFATFCDGPKPLEFWDIVTTYRMTSAAKTILPPECKVGLSVLQKEDYKSISQKLDMQSYDYIELNYKFSFRPLSKFIEDGLEELISDLNIFFETFSKLPVLVKLARETAPLIGTSKFQQIIDIVNEAEAGLIVANSRKCFVPPSLIHGRNLKELDGVIVGEHLFIDTYNMIKSLKQSYESDNCIPPIVASGGASNISEVVDFIAAGANAVQLCTVLDTMGPQVLLWLKEQLKKICEEFGSFDSFLEGIRGDDAKWQKAALLAQTYGFDQQLIVNNALKDKTCILNIFKESIFEECKEDVKPIEREKSLYLPNYIRFVVILGNASSFLLARRCVIKYGLMPLEFKSTSNFIKKASEDDFDYDFAIIPRSSLAHLQKQPDSVAEKNFPKVLKTVSNSVFELVGKKGTNLKNVETVYHFGGTSSRNALSDLLIQHKPQSLELIKSKLKLLPLFQFWSDFSAILAKPPLSRIYGLLGRGDLKENWDIIWKTKEDLLLVASSRFVSEDKDSEIIKAMINNINIEKASILNNPMRRSQDLINLGFVVHCSDLLVSS